MTLFTITIPELVLEDSAPDLQQNRLTELTCDVHEAILSAAGIDELLEAERGTGIIVIEIDAETIISTKNDIRCRLADLDISNIYFSEE